MRRTVTVKTSKMSIWLRRTRLALLVVLKRKAVERTNNKARPLRRHNMFYCATRYGMKEEDDDRPEESSRKHHVPPE